MRRATQAGWCMAAVAALLVVGACARKPAADLNGSDARAVAIADQVIAALGGQQRWNDLRGLRWTFGSQLGDSQRRGMRGCVVRGRRAQGLSNSAGGNSDTASTWFVNTLSESRRCSVGNHRLECSSQPPHV